MTQTIIGDNLMQTNSLENLQPFQLKPDNVSDWKVLIVDDIADNLSVLSTILEINGAQIATASNGIEGIEMMLRFQPNLILLDLAMPEMDGWEMKQIMDSMPAIAHMPVIAVSAFQSSEARIKARNAGFAGLIAKPFPVTKIVSEICRMLDNKS